MSTTLYVTPAQVLAAELAVELSEEEGEAPDEALKAISGLHLIFIRDYVRDDSGSKKTYAQGTFCFPTYVHTSPRGEVTHVDVRLGDDEFLPNVPVEYFMA